MTNKCTCGKSAHEDNAIYCSQCGEKLPVLQFGRAAKGEAYWYVDDDGVIIVRHDNYDSKDNARFKCGNHYPTEAEAVQAAKEQKLNALAKRWRAQHDPAELDWKNDNIAKWDFFYNWRTDELKARGIYCYKDSSLYFSTQALAEQFAAEYRELILDFLGVERQ